MGGVVRPFLGIDAPAFFGSLLQLPSFLRCRARASPSPAAVQPFHSSPQSEERGIASQWTPELLVISRYRIVRGARPPGDPLPDGIRQDTRKHTRHALRPNEGDVWRFLASPSDGAFESFCKSYLARLRRRFDEERERFDELAALARKEDVYLGCNCPTKRQPDVRRCHTILALRFLREAYPDLEVVEPEL